MGARLGQGALLLGPLPGPGPRSTCISPGERMKPVIHWFRQDLRLSDHPVLRASCASALAQGAPWLAVFVWDPVQTQATRWVAQRMGPHRLLALHQALSQLSEGLRAQGHSLVVLQGEPTQAITQLVACTGAGEVWSEQLPAPEEAAVDQALAQAARQGGWRWQTRHQGGLFELADLPFSLAQTPDVFTAFRQSVQRSGLKAEAPQARPTEWPRPLTDPVLPAPAHPWPQALLDAPSSVHADPRSSFPLTEPTWHIGEQAAQAHWARALPGAGSGAPLQGHPQRPAWHGVLHQARTLAGLGRDLGAAGSARTANLGGRARRQRQQRLGHLRAAVARALSAAPLQAWPAALPRQGPWPAACAHSRPCRLRALVPGADRPHPG